MDYLAFLVAVEDVLWVVRFSALPYRRGFTKTININKTKQKNNNNNNKYKEKKIMASLAVSS